jgi:hypothetical protein
MCSNFKIIVISSSPLALYIINVKILFNFSKELCTFGRKKTHLKNTKIVHFQILIDLNMQKKKKKKLCQALNM